MAELHTLFHERVDDIPLIIGTAQAVGLPEVFERHIGPHGSQQGLDNGQLAVGWLAYILFRGGPSQVGGASLGRESVAHLGASSGGSDSQSGV